MKSTVVKSQFVGLHVDKVLLNGDIPGMNFMSLDR